MAFLERIDDWLSAHEAKDNDGARLGAGLYYIEDTRPKARNSDRGELVLDQVIHHERAAGTELN